jgi:hypothetical protein
MIKWSEMANEMENKAARLKSDIKDLIKLYSPQVRPELTELLESDSYSEETISQLEKTWTSLDSNRSSFLTEAIKKCRLEIQEKWAQCLYDPKSKTEFMLYLTRAESKLSQFKSISIHTDILINRGYFVIRQFQRGAPQNAHELLGWSV